MGGGLAEPRGQIYQIVMPDTNGRVGGGRHLPANADRSTIGPMKQIGFELPPELFEEANRVARVQGISLAAVVTQGLELLLDSYPDEPRASNGPPADSMSARAAGATASSTEEPISRGET